MSSNRTEAEHIAFEEAAAILKEYRKKYKTLRFVVTCESVALLILLAVNIWITTYLNF